jgi:hypothetical protein
MQEMMTHSSFIGALLIWGAMVGQNDSASRAKSDVIALDDVFTLTAEEVSRSNYARTPHVDSVEWNGQILAWQEGMALLSAIAANPAVEMEKRAAALTTLGSLNVRLRGSDCVPVLLNLYRPDSPLELKLEVLKCLCVSHDVRAIPLFSSVLAKEPDEFLRLMAAGGIATWNVRSGVRELFQRLSATAAKDHSRTVGEEAGRLLASLNARKGWGLPTEGDLRAAIGDPQKYDKDELVRLASELYQKWFSENEHRFPDWKPGDPLPAVQPQDKE